MSCAFGKRLRLQSHACRYFTGAVNVRTRSNIALEGEIVFENNTAYFGGETLKYIILCT